MKIDPVEKGEKERERERERREYIYCNLDTVSESKASS